MADSIVSAGAAPDDIIATARTAIATTHRTHHIALIATTSGGGTRRETLHF
jgi:hypothetical protein